MFISNAQMETLRRAGEAAASIAARLPSAP